MSYLDIDCHRGHRHNVATIGQLADIASELPEIIVALQGLEIFLARGEYVQVMHAAEKAVNLGGMTVAVFGEIAREVAGIGELAVHGKMKWRGGREAPPRADALRTEAEGVHPRVLLAAWREIPAEPVGPEWD